MKGFLEICGIYEIMGSSRFREVGVVKGLRERVKSFSVSDS